MAVYELELEAVVYQEGDGYIAQCLNVNVVSDGATEQEALNNLHEALELYFEDERQPKVLPVEHAKVTKLKLQSA